MTGDVNLTHIRDALKLANLRSSRLLDATFAQLAAAEAVIQAARDVWGSQGGPDSLRMLGDALAALGDGQ